MERVYRLQSILSEGKYPSRAALAKKLEVNVRTIARDLDFMRDRLNSPIEFDARRKGYHFTKALDKLPPMRVSEGEIVALILAQRALDEFHGTPFEQSLCNALAKLQASLPDSISLRPERLAEAVAFRPSGLPHPDPKLFQRLCDAVTGETEVDLHYRKPDETSATSRRVRPYQIACLKGKWYLFAYDLRAEEVRTFLLTRVTEVHTTKVTFQKPKDFSLDTHLGGSFGVFSGEGKHSVTIRFSAKVAQHVRERVWHTSQKTKLLPDGSLELQLQLSDLTEITSWILSWGAEAEALAPASLVKQLRETIASMSARYGTSPNKVLKKQSR